MRRSSCSSRAATSSGISARIAVLASYRMAVLAAVQNSTVEGGWLVPHKQGPAAMILRPCGAWTAARDQNGGRCPGSIQTRLMLRFIKETAPR
jgi:hypothetical protein